MPALKVLARGSAMVWVPDTTRPRRFVGRSFDPSFGPAGAWPKVKTPVEIPEGGDLHEAASSALRHGDLWPADKATADAVGIDFDPKFGGDEELASVPKSAPKGEGK